MSDNGGQKVGRDAVSHVGQPDENTVTLLDEGGYVTPPTPVQVPTLPHFFIYFYFFNAPTH